ncbi:MAG: hypothetical protein ACLS95_03655 [Clostridia bacterium]
MAKKEKSIPQIRTEITILFENYPLKSGKQDFSAQITSCFSKKDYSSVIKRLKIFEEVHGGEIDCIEFVGRCRQIRKALSKYTLT